MTLFTKFKNNTKTINYANAKKFDSNIDVDKKFEKCVFLHL